MLARLFALAVGTLALASLRAGFDSLQGAAAALPLPGKLWFLAGFFAVLTNWLVAGHMLAVARGWQMGASRAAGLLVSALLAGVLYHAVLARLWAPDGAAWWAHQGLQTAVPLATALWWLAFAPKAVTASDLPWWLLWPAVYCGYAVLRGGLTGFWPYPLLTGGGGTALAVAGFLLTSAAIGLAVVALARWLRSA